MTQPLYEFTIRYVDRPTDTYYYTNWDNSVVTTVIAPTKDQAFKSLWAMLGSAGNHRTWTGRIISSMAAPTPRLDPARGVLLAIDALLSVRVGEPTATETAIASLVTDALQTMKETA